MQKKIPLSCTEVPVGLKTGVFFKSFPTLFFLIALFYLDKLCATLDYEMAGTAFNRFQVVASKQPEASQYPHKSEISNMFFMSDQFSAVTVESGCYIDLFDLVDFAGQTVRIDALASIASVYKARVLNMAYPGYAKIFHRFSIKL